MKIRGRLKLAFLACLASSFAYCQGGSMLLKQRLRDLEKKYGITFSYDSELISGVKIEADSSETGIEEALSKLETVSAFSFQRTAEGNILVKPKHAAKNLLICAVITDEETKEPLPGVVLFNNQRTFSAATGENGQFTAYAALKELDTLHLVYFGKELKTIPGEVFNGTGCPEIMVKGTSDLNEVVVKAYLSTGIDYKLKEHSIEIKPKAMGILPGETDADILMALDALPGINTPDSRAGNINIRGSTPDQTLIVFDNIPIYHKGHYFGTLSPYNSAIIEGINVSRSAYSADKGGRIAGAIEIFSKKDIPDSVVSEISLSGISASAFTQVPLVKNKLGILLAGRSSYPFNWNSPKLKAINDLIYQKTAVSEGESRPSSLVGKSFHFYDFNAKVIARPGKKDELLLSMLGISNLVDIKITDNLSHTTSYYNMKLANRGYNLLWTRKFSEKVSTLASVTQSDYRQEYPTRIIAGKDTVKQKAYYRNQINDMDLKLEADILQGRFSLWKAGYDLHYNQVNYNNTLSDYDTLTKNVSKNDFSFLNILFVNYTISSRKFMINGGLRVNYYSPTQKVYPEPRLLANYNVNNRLTLKSSAGLYNQFITQIPGTAIASVGGVENLVWLLGNGSTIPVIKSRQAALGLIYKKNSFIVDVEGYYKKTGNLTISNINNFHNSAIPYYYGSGKTIGVDLLVKKSWRRLDTWVSYTCSKALLQFDSIQKEAFLSPSNQTHVLDLVVMYSLKRWKFSSGWKFRSGLPALPDIRSKYTHGAAPETASPNGGVVPGPPGPGGGMPPPPPPQQQQPASFSSGDKTYTSVFPVYHQLDLSIVYVLLKEPKKWNGTMGLSILNVYNRRNVIDQQLIPQGNTLGTLTRYAIGFAPNLVLTINW